METPTAVQGLVKVRSPKEREAVTVGIRRENPTGNERLMVVKASSQESMNTVVKKRDHG